MGKLLKVEDYCDLSKDAARWYVVNAEPNREKLALASLTGGGFDAYLPMRAIEKKAETHAAPLFPRYLFVRLDLEDETWWRVFTMHGVASVITRTRSVGRPLPVPIERGAVRRIRAEEIDGLILLKGAPKASKASPFKPGMSVKITKGPMSGFDAIFQHGDANRITVMMSMLGSERTVHMPVDHAAPAKPGA